MAILVGIVWSVVSFFTIFLTNKYWLPKMKQKYNESTSNDVSFYIMLLVAIYSGICGYFSVFRLHSYMSIEAFKIVAVCMVTASVFVLDLSIMKIPNICTVMLLGAGVIASAIQFFIDRKLAISLLLNGLVAMIVTFLILFAMRRITKGGLGLGDVKILSALGFVCGFRAVMVTLFMSFAICVLFSTGLILLKKRGLKDVLPLGPFIFLGFGTSIILGII